MNLRLYLYTKAVTLVACRTTSCTYMYKDLLDLNGNIECHRVPYSVPSFSHVTSHAVLIYVPHYFYNVTTLDNLDEKMTSRLNIQVTSSTDRNDNINPFGKSFLAENNSITVIMNLDILNL